MTSVEVSTARVHVNKRLLTAGVGLMAIGGVLGFAGMALGGFAVLAAVREYVGHMEVPPRELAARTWHQAKEASLAGARAWREAAPTARH